MEPTLETPVLRRYDDIVDGYVEHVRTSIIHGVAFGALLPLCAPGGTVLDLACGEGILARELAARGNRVVGIDIAERLLALARAEEERAPLGISYRRIDGTTLTGLDDGSFDGVATSLTSTDIDDLAAVVRSVVRVLAPGGWFASASLHPCFEPPHARTVEVEGRATKQLNGYFEEGPWRSRNPDSLISVRHHRRLGTILNMLIEAGLVVERVEEPIGDTAAVARSAIYGEVAEVLVVRAVKPG
jgi:2-polyprenyl-3-methyl-5-hydroxy-6-metoxy-1,4-benzoquinol methylase